jgi:hypothetical protein
MFPRENVRMEYSVVTYLYPTEGERTISVRPSIPTVMRTGSTGGSFQPGWWLSRNFGCHAQQDRGRMATKGNVGSTPIVFRTT